MVKFKPTRHTFLFTIAQHLSLHTSAQKQTTEAREKFRRHSYKRAVTLFQLCLLLHPEDDSGVRFRRSVQSHQATAYFKLKKYRKALEVGEKSYNSNPTFKSKVRYILASNAPLRSDLD